MNLPAPASPWRLAFTLALLAALPTWADAGLSLYLAEPNRPGRLEDCSQPPDRQPAERWTRVDWSLNLRWRGGETRLNPANPGAAAGTLQERCFRLDLDGSPLVWGAAVSPYSARYLDFPVLLTDRIHDARDAQLKPSLIGEPAGHAIWWQTLLHRFPPTPSNPTQP